MSAIELSRLAECEEIIEQGLQTFYDVGTALIEIRNGRLYRADYPTFEEYCQERWGFSDRNALYYMQAATVIDNIQNSKSSSSLPLNVNQTVALSKLKTPEQQQEAWQKAVETAPNGSVTGAHVKRVVDEMLGKAPDAVEDVVASPTALNIDFETGEILQTELEPEPFNYKRDMKSNRAGIVYEPQGYDACQTPPYAIDPLLPYLTRGQIIWEPARGEGHLVEAFYDAGFKEVVTSDMLTGENFFEYEPVERWDCIITNPPYSLKFEWLERCYELGKPFALLVPVEMLGAGKAQELMQQHGFEIMLLSRRVDFKMPNAGWSGAGSQFPVMWLCWNLLPQPVVFGDIPIEVKKAWHNAQ